MTNRFTRFRLMLLVCISVVLVAVIAAKIYKSYQRPSMGYWQFHNLNGTLIKGTFRLDTPDAPWLTNISSEASGVLQLSLASGLIFSEYQFSNGVQNGEAYIKDQAGQLVFKAFYVEGQLDGTNLSWHHNGIQASEGQYIKGKKVKQHFAWYKDGTLKADVFYEEGLFHGRHRHWAQDGSLFADGVYSNMWAQDGTFILEKKEGKPPVIGIYSNGVLIKKQIWKPAQ